MYLWTIHLLSFPLTSSPVQPRPPSSHFLNSTVVAARILDTPAVELELDLDIHLAFPRDYFHLGIEPLEELEKSELAIPHPDQNLEDLS